jgi:hypothetical protein
MLRLLALAATLITVFLAAQGVAHAESMTVACNDDCTGAKWVGASLKVQFNWTGTEQTMSPGCHNGDLFTPEVEGDQQITCVVTYADASTASATAHVKFDKTPPTLVSSGVPTLQPNANGWFSRRFSVGYGWSDGLSGVNPDYCDTSVDYEGDETAPLAPNFVQGTCADQAGNLAVAPAFPVLFDNTAPVNVAGAASRAPDANGWYTHPVIYTFTGSDLTPGSGIDKCDTITYSGPDSDDTTVKGGCVDKAGNLTQVVKSLGYDSTKPTVDGATPNSNPNTAGWYNGPVTFRFHGSDAVSGIASCTDETYSGADGDAAQVTGTCTDGAGNSATKAVTFKYDATAPTVTDATPDRQPDHGGWYNGPVKFTLHGSDALSGIASCSSETYSGLDDGSAQVTGACVDTAGNSASKTVSFKYDATAPTVTGVSADRPPDHGDWYTRPVTFSFHGVDATSGGTTCGSVAYSGPDGGSAQVVGKCVDAAGNAASKAVTFKYDSSPPAKSKLYAVPADKSIDLSWTPVGDADKYVITRTPAVGAAVATPIYSGSAVHFVDTGLANGKKYNYSLTVLDAAGNSSTAGIAAVADGSTLRPFIDTELQELPVLSWGKVKTASYYNLQLFKGKKKVMSIWPHTTKAQLPGQWKYHGRKQTLSAGLYRWYVWPGIGAMKRHRYGKLVGSSTFRFAK